MPPFVRDQALTGEVLARLACLPDEGKVRAKTIEAAVLLIAHDAIVEIDTDEGRGYATVEAADQLAARIRIPEKRLREALRHLCAVGLFTKTAGVSLGDNNGSEPDWYWLRTIPGVYVPPAQPARFAPSQNDQVRLSTGAFASGQNDQVRIGSTPIDQRDAIDIEQPKRPGVVVCSTPPSPPVKHNNTTTHPVEPAASAVADLDSYRPVTRSDGSPITDEVLRQVLTSAGFKGRLLPDVEAAFDTAGPISAEYVTLQHARGKGPGWMIKALKASGPAAIWDAFPDQPAAQGDHHVDRIPAGPRAWMSTHCGQCDEVDRTYIDPEDPQRIQRRCPRCHDDLRAEIQQRRDAIHAANTQPPARVVGENPF
jgi:phage FluMu protein Com